MCVNCSGVLLNSIYGDSMISEMYRKQESGIFAKYLVSQVILLLEKNIFSIALCNKQASFFLFLMKFFALYIAISQLKWFFKQMISENDCFVYISQLTLCISSNFKTLKIRIQDTVKEPFTNILTYILKENIHDI